jgi:hypothetical protein
LRAVYRRLARVVGWRSTRIDGSALVAGVTLLLLGAALTARFWSAPLL